DEAASHALRIDQIGQVADKVEQAIIRHRRRIPGSRASTTTATTTRFTPTPTPRPTPTKDAYVDVIVRRRGRRRFPRRKRGRGRGRLFPSHLHSAGISDPSPAKK